MVQEILKDRHLGTAAKVDLVWYMTGGVQLLKLVVSVGLASGKMGWLQQTEVSV